MDTVEPEVRTQIPVVDGLSTDFLARLGSDETPFAIAIRRVADDVEVGEAVAKFNNYV
jgi:hypothetical protein